MTAETAPVTYTVGSQWPGGFTGNARLTNLGDPLNGWTLTWTFTAGQAITQAWHAVVSQSGAQVTARNQAWNASLGTGGSVDIGFNASWNNSANPVPTASGAGTMWALGTFYNGSQPMFIRPLSNPWTASGPRRIVSTPTLAWETVGGGVNEGGEVLQRNGRTFIIYSASHCSTPDYELGMLTYNGGDPLNSSSWTKSPQPMFQRSNANGVYGPGHNGFFKSPDGTEDWIAHHANSSTSGGCDMNRSTRAQRFTWNADGTRTSARRWRPG